MYMEKFAFIGPNEYSFDKKKSNKVKKLVHYLFDYEFSVVEPDSNSIGLSIKPNTGFTSVVAEAILDYQEKHPDKVFKILLFTEYKTDFEELPIKTQQLFDKLVGYDGTTYRKVMCMGRKENPKGVYSMMTSQGTPVYYYDPEAKKDSSFMKELKWIVTPRKSINLFENLSGQAYQGDGIRKKSTAMTYAYRINANLPNGKRLTEELSGFITTRHAKIARNKRLIEAMWQDVEPNLITLSELFDEYIETKGSTPSLQAKYKQYYNSFIGEDAGNTKVQWFVDCGVEEYLITSKFHRFSLAVATDSRYKEDGFYDEDNMWKQRYLTDAYKQGFYAMLSNVFDYAYHRGYISYQPMLLFDISKL